MGSWSQCSANLFFPKSLEMMQNHNLSSGWKMASYLTPSLPLTHP